jgi:hypothetical protein
MASQVINHCDDLTCPPIKHDSVWGNNVPQASRRELVSTRTEKWMRGINTCAETLALANQLLNTARQRAKSVSREAERFAHDFRNDAASRAESLGKTAAKHLRTKTSPSTRAIQFFAGVGVGLAAGVIFAPSTGKEIRERIRTKATRLANKEPEVSSSY